MKAPRETGVGATAGEEGSPTDSSQPKQSRQTWRNPENAALDCSELGADWLWGARWGWPGGGAVEERHGGGQDRQLLQGLLLPLPPHPQACRALSGAHGCRGRGGGQAGVGDAGRWQRCWTAGPGKRPLLQAVTGGEGDNGSPQPCWPHLPSCYGATGPKSPPPWSLGERRMDAGGRPGSCLTCRSPLPAAPSPLPRYVAGGAAGRLRPQGHCAQWASEERPLLRTAPTPGPAPPCPG